jgi:hypothetical protein
MLENTDDAYGFPPFRYLAPVLVIGGEREAELRDRERKLMTSVLERVRVRRMTSDNFDWADRIPTVLGG